MLDRRTLLGLGVAAGLGAAFLPQLVRAAVDPVHLPHVHAMVERWVGAGRLPGLVASFGRGGQETGYIVRGSEGFTDADAMGPDTLFRIYSMTKPVTGMAVMHLIAQGKLRLDQPLYDILPRFRHMMVQDKYDGSIKALHPARTAITIRHLLTHTAGIGYTIVQTGPIANLMNAKGLIPGRISRLPAPGIFNGTPAPSLEAFADRLAEVPLVAQPGTAWHYSMSLDLLGRVIEVVTGRPFNAYLHETILGPAGMTSSWFQVPAREAHRLATNYGVLGGILVPIDQGSDSIFLDKPAFPFGGSGLVSSPRDFDRFLRMLAQGGMIDGRRVLLEEAVRAGTRNLLPAGLVVPGIGHFGAGGRVGTGAEAGIFGWSGAAGTVAMVDMVRGLRSQIFAQFMPSGALPVLNEFQTALRADVTALLKDT